MGDPTRGITCPDMRRVVREAIAGGWEWAGMTGTTHARLRWTDGSTVSFGLTPSVASWKSLATDIKKISGVECWRKGNRKRSRKADQTSGFSMGAARREAEQREKASREAARIHAAAERARQEAQRRAVAEERRRRDIEDLMRPGWGR